MQTKALIPPPFIFVHQDLCTVVNKLEVYIELSKKFIARHKGYQYVKHLAKLPDGKWCLIFKVLPSNHEAVRDYNNTKESSKKEMWLMYINNITEG
jgi:hypothetical protein